jgi:hypothetical protein
VKIPGVLMMSMEEQLMREELVAHLNHSPFAAFSIHFTDGVKFDVVRPFQAGIGLSKGLVVSADLKAHRNFHLSDIRSIKVLVPA